MRKRDPFADLLGFGWSDVANAGRVAFPFIHQAGAGVLNAFGAGAVVKPLETLEQRGGLLPNAPPMPQGAPSPTGGRVPPGAMPMSKTTTTSAPSTPTKTKVHPWKRPIEIASVGALVVGVVMLIAKGKRK